MSALALEALLEEGGPQLLTEVLASTHAKGLGSLAPKWLADTRPAVRLQLLAYVDDGCNQKHHQPLIKRLFKLAEAQRDHELMAHFLVAFDRSARRTLVKRGRWDWAARELLEEESLTVDPSIPKGAAPTAKMKPVNGAVPPVPKTSWGGKGSHLSGFTYRTRRYLQRRAWRYFRQLGKQNEREYVSAILTALKLYDDKNLQQTSDFLSAWGLMHILYHHSDVVVQEREGWNVAPEADFATLEPAPIFASAWTELSEPLLFLAIHGRATVVRSFAIAQLKQHHASKLDGLPLAEIRSLLTSEHEEVQIFAAELIDKASGLELLSVNDWMKLLAIENQMAIPVLCRLFEKHVTPDRLDRDACLKLACTRTAPVAELGLDWLKAHPIRSQEDIHALLTLAEAEAEVVRVKAIEWLVDSLKASPFSTWKHARRLIDAHHEDVRRTAGAWFVADETLSREVQLWAAMSETPYADVRATFLTRVVELSPELTPDSVRHVWATVLLGIHRGSRDKPRAARQIAERVADHPMEADLLLPLLSISLRSLRAPERRSAIAAVAQAAFHNPSLRPSISQHLPELELFADETASGGA